MPAIHRFGTFRLDPGTEILFRGNEPVALGRRAVALLRLLVERPRTPISKRELIEAGWDGLVVEESNLTTQIAAIRRALGQEAGGAAWIETLSRRGYRYVGPAVTKASADISAAPEAEGAPPALPSKPSIAVLAFQNMSRDREQDYLADGIVDDIITSLARIRSMFVIARNSSFSYKGRAVQVKQVGRELGVRYVLDGCVRKAGDRIRITTQLIEAETGTHLWAERYDRLLDDIFATQDEIALQVVGAIEPSIRMAEIDRVRRTRPGSLDAYDLVLRASPFLYSGMPDGVAAAIPLLEKALEIEPGYARAHADLAWCFHHRFSRGELREDDRAAAIRHAHAAVAWGGDDASALAIAAFVISLDEHDNAAALDLFDRALALSGSNTFALGCSAVTLGWLGKTALAIERAEQALRLSPFDPLNVRPRCALAIAHFQRKRYAEAAGAARKAIGFNPTFSVPHALLTAALVRLGYLGDAKASARQLLMLQPTFSARGFSRTVGLSPAVFAAFAKAWHEAGLPE